MSTDRTQPGRLGTLAARMGLSEGQAYTVALLLLVAALLTSSLTGLTGRIAEVAAAPLQPATTTTTTTATTTPTLPDLAPVPFTPPATSPTATPAPPTTAPPSFPPAPPFEPLTPEAPPVPPVCDADPLIAAARDGLTALDTLTGGIVPNGTIVSALAVATGCSNTDPAVLLLAGLIEIGQGLPDLGLGIIELPVLPFLVIPKLVIDLVQPLRDVLDPICGTISTASLITSQAGPAYPPPFNAVFSVSLFYALATCGQLQSP